MDLFLTNWSGTWTPEQQALAAAGKVTMLSCSPARVSSPLAGVPALIGTQAAVGLFKGLPPGTPGSFQYDVADEAVKLGYDILPLVRADGRTIGGRWWTYSGANGTTTHALNLARPVVARWWADQFVKHYGPWAAGWHGDYWTPLAFVDQSQFYLSGVPVAAYGGDEFWWKYQDGLSLIAHRIRSTWPASRLTQPIIIGQQGQNMRGARDMAQLNGRYVEQWPGMWGTPPWQAYHRAQFNAFATQSSFAGRHVLEVRYPLAHTTEELVALTNFANQENVMVSWGRDQQAGVGFPTN
jgi:hypothetical protein